MTDEHPPRSRRRTRVGLLLALLVTLGVIVALVGARAANLIPRSDGNVLVLIDPVGTVTTVDSTGGSRSSTPVEGTAFQFPAWSSDGTRIAAIGSSDAAGGGVYVFNAGSGRIAAAAPVAVYRSHDHRPFYLYWTPDGLRIAFLTSESDGLALRVAPSDASAEATVLRQGSPLYWTWSLPGGLFVHSGGDAADAFVGEVGFDGLAVPAAGVLPGPFRAPALSADGHLRAFEVKAADGSTAIVLGSRERSAEQSIEVFGQAALTFGPSGANLAFIAADAPVAPTPIPIGPLRLVHGVGGQVTTLVDGAVIAFFWSPDGRTIATLRVVPGGQPNAARGQRDTAVPAGFRPGARDAEPVQASGFELQLVFSDVASGVLRAERSVVVSELFATQVIPFFDQYALSHRLWSADSRSIALPLVTGEEIHIVVISADGSETRDLGAGQIAFWSP